jgi:transposase
VEKIVKLDEAQCRCGQCGQCLDVIGYETSEQLEVEPARYFVLVTKREKRACGSCGQAGVKTAAVEARIVDKSLVSNRAITCRFTGRARCWSGRRASRSTGQRWMAG